MSKQVFTWLCFALVAAAVLYFCWGLPASFRP
jgi:hypothetical protein